MDGERPRGADGRRETLPCGLVFRSVGYHGVELPDVAFDSASGTIPHDGGRVEPGIYVAGWIKRGPTGVIGTNKKDATETVELLLEDAAAGRLEPKPDANAAAVDALLAERGVRVVEYPVGRRSTRSSAPPARGWTATRSSCALPGRSCFPPRNGSVSRS